MKPLKPVQENWKETDDDNLEEDGEKKPRQLPSLRSRATLLVVSIVVAIILLLISIPGLFNNSALKLKVEQKASQILGTNLEIKGGVQVAIFPYPAITAHNVLLQNLKKDEVIYNFYAGSVKIRLSLLKFFKKEFEITSISFSDAILETFYAANSDVKRQNKFTEANQKFVTIAAGNKDQTPADGVSNTLFSVDKFQSSQFSISNLPKFEIENGNIISYDKFSHSREIDEIEVSAKISANQIRAFGTFNNNKVSSDFKLTANFNSEISEQDSTIELNSPNMNLVIKGSFTAENKGLLNSNFSGKIEAEITELRSFYRDYISNGNAIYNKLKQNNQPIKISGNIQNIGGEILLDEIVVNSGLVNGKGSAIIDFNSDLPKIDITLDLANLDLDNIWSNERVETKSTPPTNDLIQSGNNETAEALPLKNLNLAVTTSTPTPNKKTDTLDLKIANNLKNFDLSAEVTIKEVKYFEGQIKDLNLYLTVSKAGQIMILPMTFNIPGDAAVRINGVLENDSDLPKFIGKIDINGKNLGDSFKWLRLQSQNLKFDNLKDYIIYSDVLLIPNNITLNNLYLNLNNGKSELLGAATIDSSNAVTNITNKFHISTFNIDDFFLTSAQNIYLSPGSLLRKLFWLNELSATNFSELSFDKLIYKNEVFSGPSSFKLSLGQGYLKIAGLQLNSNKTNLKADLSVDLSNQNPLFDLNLAADNFHHESSQLTRTEAGKDYPALKKNNIADQFFALPSLEGFSGNIAISTTNLRLDDLLIGNANISGKLQDGNITTAVANCDIYDGTLKYKGLVGIKADKTINGNLTLNNIALDQMLHNIAGIENIGGTTNISASITAVASSKENFLKGITSEIKFNAASPIVSGYGLRDLVNKMFYPTNFRRELQNPEQILFNKNAVTIFKQASGTILLDKDKGSKVSINFNASAINGVLSGKINLSENSIDALANIIFVTGSRQKQVPLNIATALKGNMSNISQSSNLDQVKQYLGIIPIKAVGTNKTTAPSDTRNQTNSILQPAINPELGKAFDQINEISANPNLPKTTATSP